MSDSKAALLNSYTLDASKTQEIGAMSSSPVPLHMPEPTTSWANPQLPTPSPQADAQAPPPAYEDYSHATPSPQPQPQPSRQPQPTRPSSHQSRPSSSRAPARPSVSPASSSSYSTPACFSRQVPHNLAYPDFMPTFLIANGDGEHIHKGFPITIPPSTAYPHPLESHGVPIEDWKIFLQDVQEKATLSDEQKSRARLPLISLIPVVNIIVREGIKTLMKSRKVHPVCRLIHLWNHHYFNPRRMEVILMQGNARVDQERAPLPKAYEKEGFTQTAGGSNLNFNDDKTFRLVLRSLSEPVL
ncbi:hypothetical protein HDZ31DRAFT_39735 [Schizophyllum fasciatum]